jgi:predicted CoA-substrate-specific enzyme activase
MAEYLGIDVGSVATKLAVLDETGALLASVTLPTAGEPLKAVRAGLRELADSVPQARVAATAVTGSARELVGRMVGARLVKNEITAQAEGTLHFLPEARTVIEIGGQDSKGILLRDGLVADFNMNTVCAAGTGSFLDHQAHRLGLSAAEFGTLALESREPIELGGRCTVFAESDMVHRQQTGSSLPDIVYGLCLTLARNYLTGVAAGKELDPPIVFQGGLAYNRGMVRAFEAELGTRLVIPPHPALMGAIGAALLARREAKPAAEAA